MYTLDDALRRTLPLGKGDYQPWSLDGPGGINDSFQDIFNSQQGARGLPIDLDGAQYPSE